MQMSRRAHLRISRLVDYQRLNYYEAAHHRRYQRRVEAEGLPCQACRGMGEFRGSSYYEPPEPCGWCETTGKVTKWMRGFWLRWKRFEASTQP